MQEDVGRLVEGGAHHRITAAADVAIVISLSGAVAPWRQTEVRSDVSRSREAPACVDAGSESKRHQGAAAGNGHQPVTDGTPPRQLTTQAIEPLEFFDQRSANAQHWLGDREQAAVFRDQLKHPRLE